MKIDTEQWKRFLKEAKYEKTYGMSYGDEIRKHFLSFVMEEGFRYAFRMMIYPKIGLNPKKCFSTPMGVDFYPLDFSHLLKLLKSPDYFSRLECLPYQSGASFIGLVRLNNFDISGKWMKLGFRFGKENKTHHYLDIKQKLYKEYSDLHKKEDDISLSKKFAKILRELGYIGVYDDGTGSIHDNEPAQITALIPSAYSTIDIYETKVLRKQYPGDKYNLINLTSLYDGSINITDIE